MERRGEGRGGRKCRRRTYDAGDFVGDEIGWLIFVIFR